MNLSIDTIRKWWEKSSKQQRMLAVLFSIGILATGMLLLITGAPASQNDTLGSSLYYAGVVVKLVGVLLLIVGVGVVARRWQTRGGNILGRQLKVVETVRLSPKQALHVVHVGERRLLIGATDQGISILSELEALPLAVAQTPIPDDTSVRPVEKPNFNEYLQAFNQPASKGELEGRS